MAAPTNTYCDYALGNDYKGASFVDGAYTSATKTLIKAGAFAASKVNHWLKLSSNDGGSIVAGYYKIATWTDADTVILATDAGAGVDDDAAKCTQHDGTTSLPWRSVQGALDLITRDATNGDQVNVKAGTAQVNQAALTLATYGTPSVSVQLTIRGCTATANDGGKAEIDCNGAALFASASYTLNLIDLQLHNFGNNHGVNLGQGSIIGCNIHKGASSPSSKSLISINSIAWIYGNHIHDAGTGGTGISGGGATSRYNYIYNCVTGINTGTNNQNVAFNLIVDCTTGILAALQSVVTSNTIYHSGASTGKGISSTANGVSIYNNIVEGYSGAGGVGISSTGELGAVGYNATYNNTTATAYGDNIINFGADVALASSPFTNAAGGDFSLATAVVGAIDGAFPGAWYGPAATTDHADIGAVQNPAGTGGAVKILPLGKVGL